MLIYIRKKIFPSFNSEEQVIDENTQSSFWEALWMLMIMNSQTNIKN